MLKTILLLLPLMPIPAYAQESMDEVREISKRLIPEQFDDWQEGRRISWLAQNLETAKSPGEIYVLKRTLFNEKFSKDDAKGAAQICLGMKLVTDDFAFRLRCVDAGEGIVSHDDALVQLHDILQDARRLKRNGDAVDTLNSIAWIQSQDGDISESLANYAEALELVPKEDERTRFNVLFNLATNYIIHGNAEYIRKGIGLLTEIKIRGAERAKESAEDQAKLFLNDSQLAAFNIGIAYTLHLMDYEKAIPEFEYSKALGDSNRVEALTFSALAAAEIGRFDQAKKFLAEINGEESRLRLKEGYLKCYRALAVRHWDLKHSIKPCFELDPDTTLEVVSDINKHLVRLKGQPEEIDGLRAYVKMYEEKIEPEYKKRAAKAASNTELKRLETDAKLKDEKIALGEKIKTLLYVVLVISVLLLGLMLVVLRSRRIIKLQAADIHLQKQNLQHVLDNIDEGIVAIDRHGRVSQVFSRHASEILKKNPAQMTLPELLAAVGLESDALASAQQVFGAVLGEEPLAWQLNEGLLPRSGFIYGTPFQYYWSPIETEGRVSEIILSMRDATATLALQKEAHTRNRILSVVSAGAVGYNFIWDLDARLQLVRQGIHKNGAAHCLRVAHTIKGEARSLGFTDLQDQLHLFEQSLLQEDFSQASRIMDGIENAARSLHEAFDMIKQGDRRAHGNPMMGMLQTVLTDARKRLREFGFDLISDLHLNWVDLNDEEISALRDVLIHGVANSIDHGYLLPRKKNMSNDQLARICIQLHIKGDEVHFSITDHGVGIDWKALEEIARKRNWTPPKDSDLADIVFVDKVSTVAEIQVSKTSGRGIGMAAVAEAVKSLQGTIKFGPSFNHRGARLDIKWKRRVTVETRRPQAAS
ncbi:MAG TPA: ATP-binding protein [Oligoflexus sp.]|uniref:ATP-binding protein n=1 Tax=Oligoflexus sp. TaxID=1971216 RepID=UPI002D3BE1DE|nr:ATP-binding protein [Oligoflexus sp.]HYX33513.1 ATP-binding protein [Oligoflexus sp.]